MGKKYKITEQQLEKIFEILEKRRISEVDGFNYPAGADTPDAPWNKEEPTTTTPKKVSGDYELVSVSSGEYLIMNKRMNQLLYTLDEVWDQQEGSSWIDIKDRLQDFFEIPQEDFDDEGERYTDNRMDWKSDITMDEVGEAIIMYLNYNSNNNTLEGIVDAEGFNDGDGEFLVVTPESVDEIVDDTLRDKASNILN
jgi:hypothetical protein